ncbi:hypothetical protein [Streptomyces sp. NBC_01276]|uniref:hypothetical protein n=1 Tax=Streptomyces sp. NBC_01276 TaxID=2903808 RepID=UPI00352F18D8
MQDYTVSAGLSPELLAGEVTQAVRTGSYDGSRGFTVIHFHTADELAQEAAGALLADAIATARLADEYGVLADASSHVLVIGTA